jgi:hypothetical protein
MMLAHHVGTRGHSHFANDLFDPRQLLHRQLLEERNFFELFVAQRLQVEPPFGAPEQALRQGQSCKESDDRGSDEKHAWFSAGTKPPFS